MAISLVSSSLTLMDEPAHFTLSDLSLHVETIRITTNGSQAVFLSPKQQSINLNSILDINSCSLKRYI
jgi:hypothetical protein